MKIRLLIFGLLVFTTAYSQEPPKIDWKSDIEFLKSELASKHINFFSVKTKSEFESGIDKISFQQNELTNFEVAVKLQQLVASFGDSHTSINIGSLIDKSKILPLHLYWFSDGLYILHTTPANREILGKRITKINSIPIETVVDSLSTLLTIDNQSIVKSSIPRLLPLVQLLEYYRFAKDNSITLELKDSGGNISSYSIQPAQMDRQNRVMFKPDSLAFCWQNENALFIDKYFPNSNTYYLQYNRCWSKELEVKYKGGKNADRLPSFSDFENRVIQTIENDSIAKIIFDMRFNPGGDSPQGTELIERLSKIKKINQKGRLFVVIGRVTFSSAILNAMDFKEKTKAIFVGEQTSGSPNHFGQVETCTLPNSKLTVSYSTKFFNRTDDNSKTISPDYAIDVSFKDFKSGKDPVFEWIKKQEIQ